MKTNTRFSLMTAMVLLMLILSAVMTVPAYADDGVPPAPDADPAVESTPAEESAPVESAPAAEESAPETVAEVLEQLPAGTDVVVLDTSGEPLPLASEEAAAAIKTIDPRWCPTGAVPGALTCSPSYLTLQDLVAGVGVDFTPTANGTIWIEGGTFANAGDIVFDGATTAYSVPINTVWANWSNFALTFQGGWSGSNNTIVNTSTPSIINDRLDILNWGGAITLKDITVDAQVNDGADHYALNVYTDGNILLDRVTVQNGDNADGTFVMNGANLDNSGGVGNVTINNSSFLNNEGNGLEVDTNGTITTKNLVAMDNGGNGVYLEGFGAGKAVTMTGLQQYSNNGNIGLYVTSEGQITVANVIANDNGGSGAVFQNDDVAAAGAGVTVNGTNFFTNNGLDGLTVTSYGNVLMNNINASGNTNNGAYIDNCDININKCNVPAAKTVTITGTNVFNDNDLFGLAVYSYGSIAVSNITASNNSGGDGVHLDNNYQSFVGSIVSLGKITMTGYGIFNNNYGDGLEARSYQDFTAANLTANYNYGADPSDDAGGVYLYLYKAATLTGVNTFNYNGVGNIDGGNGLYIDGYGKVTLSNVTANYNEDYGAYISATLDTNSTVTLTGVNTFNGNGFIGTDGSEGLYIDAAGIITLNNVTANDNYGYGAELANDDDEDFPLGVTLAGNNTFNGNGLSGLYVTTYGAITVNNLTANGNFDTGEAGAWLVNYDSSSVTPMPVTLTGFVRVSDNDGYGLYVESWGTVTLANVTANGNGSTGVEIYNNVDPIAIGPGHLVHTVQNGVTITGVNNFNGNVGNGYSGLYIESFGAILLSAITANGNDSYGVEIYNDYINLALPKPITIKGYLVANGNGDGGAGISSRGLVTLANVTANGNLGGGGVEIDNDYDVAKQFDVKLTGTNTFNDNAVSDGLRIESYGAVSLSNVTANNNGNVGVEISNSGGNLAKAVTFTGPVKVSGNGDSGIYIYSAGAVTMGNVLANDNVNVGIEIYNNVGLTQAGVTITGTNTFGNNDADGLLIESYGTILVSNINAYGNFYHGAFLVNPGGALPKNITLTGVNTFVNNGDDGLWFSSDGMVAISRVTASGNNFEPDANGIQGNAMGSITISCAFLTDNSDYGYNLNSISSTVKINGLYAYGNGLGAGAGTPAAIIVKPCALP